MDKQAEANISTFVQRRLSQMKLLGRLVEHELTAAKGGKDVTMQRELVENMLDAIEIFVEDFERSHGDARPRSATNDAKPTVTRLN